MNIQPCFFIGHGSPMNALEDNEITQTWTKIGNNLVKPDAIICISAHWLTRGTYMTSSKNPQVIYDFGGFPDELFRQKYPAPGNPEIIGMVQSVVKDIPIQPSLEWGLDHGSWTILKFLFPKADIPVLQLSIDYPKPPLWHYEFGKYLIELRKKNILVLGSGNLVHNLGNIDWNQNSVFGWAKKANDEFKELITNFEFSKLIDYKNLGPEIQKSIPSPDHYYPFLYILGMKQAQDNLVLFNDKVENGSISMLSVQIG